MLNAFLDDSGSEPNDPLFVVAGLISTPDLWSDFSAEWDVELRRGGRALNYFKMSHAHSAEGEFQFGWTRPLIDQKVDSLAEIACKFAQYRVACVMRWSDYNMHIKEIGDATKEPFNLALRDPYFLCLSGIYIKVHSYCVRHQIDPICDYVIDDQSTVGEFARSVIRALGRSADLSAIFRSPPETKNDKFVLPLQAADLYAWHVHRWAVGQRDNSQYLHIRKGFSQLPSIELVYNAEWLAMTRSSLFASMILAPQFLRDDYT